MRIGIYDPYLDDLGGGEKYMMTIAECLSKEHQIDVFWNNPQDLLELNKRFSLDLSKVNLVSNVFSPHIVSFHRFFATRKYDAIIFLSDGSIPFVGSKKLFIHIQQPLSAMQTNSLFSRIKLSRVTSFFCNSEYTRSFIDIKFPVKSKVIYPPVSLLPKKAKKDNIILHVGRFRVIDPVTHSDDFKKQNIMLNVFKEMVKNGLKEWKFILGVSVKDEDREDFERMKSNAKGFPIEFFVNKSNEELWNFYSKAKIYWHASGFGEDLKTHPEFAEHFGISTVEAMGAGVVPVVINAGGQKEIVKDGKNGLLWNNLEELKEKTLTLIKDKKLWEKLSENAKKRAKDFNKERFCGEISSLVNS